MSDSLTDEESEIRQLLMFPEKMNTLLEKLQSDNRRSVAASANHSIKGFN